MNYCLTTEFFNDSQSSHQCLPLQIHKNEYFLQNVEVNTTADDVSLDSHIAPTHEKEPPINLTTYIAFFFLFITSFSVEFVP
jgi:hypothetical protein